MADKSTEILTLYLKYEAWNSKEKRFWRKGGIAWKQYCATMRNMERKLRRMLQ